MTDHNLRKERGAARSSEDQGPHGSTVLEGGGSRSRTLRKSVRETAAAAIGVYKDNNPTRPGEEQGGRLPRKKGTAVLWPRRGRRGQRLHRGAFSNGGIISGGAGFSRTVRDIYCRRRGLRPRPGSSGNCEKRGGACCGSSTRKGLVTGRREQRPGGASGQRAGEGTCATFPGSRVPEAGPPPSHRCDIVGYFA